MVSENFSVLMVCTANMCRSPMMELLLRKNLDRAAGGNAWSVRSAGVEAVPGRPMHPFTVEALAEYDIVEPEWRSRRLDAGLLDWADLVLVADRDHRSAVAQLSPPAVRRTFLLLPFASMVALASPIKAAGGRHPGSVLMEAAVRARSRLPLGELSKELADPVAQRMGQFRSQAAEIDQALRAILRALPKADAHPSEPGNLDNTAHRLTADGSPAVGQNPARM